MRKERGMVLGVAVLCLGALGTRAVQAQQSEVGGASSASAPGLKDVGAKGGDERGQLPVLQHRNHRYQLHSADVLELSFPFTPEFNQTVTVQPDGFITLRGIEDIHVEGLTLPEVSNSLRIAYSRIL